MTDVPKEPYLTFGQRAVGLSFNPSGNPQVERIKTLYAEIIDELHELRMTTIDPEQGRIASVGITDAQTAQMWAVKAVTWEPLL